MKKTKILTVLGVLLAMGITACGGKTASKSGSKAADGSSAGGQSASQPAPSSSKPKTHQHVWDEGRVTKDPTCEEEGEKTFTCTGEGTCPQNNTKTEKIPANGHTWGEAQPVAAANGGVSYNKYVCSVANCGAVKYDIDLTGADRLTFVDGGSLKADSNLPGWVKLASPNGGGFEIQFNSDVYGEGKIYQNGAMDHWTDNTNNTQRGFFSGNSTSSTHADENGNFALLMNGTAVDFSDKKSLTYGDMYPATDADHPAAAEGYSPLAEIETGAVKVGKGLNTIKFTRVDSFNIILKSFVIVFKPADHEHTLGEKQTGKAATCEDDGWDYQVCSTCKAKVITKVDALGHDWDDANATRVEESGYSTYIRTECKTCHKFKYDIPLYDGETQNFEFATGSANKTNNPPTPAKHIKLNGNGQSFSVKINSKKVSVGKLYQEGIFDQWPDNGKKFGYFSVTKSDDNAAQAKQTGNFKVEVNGVAIDLSQYKGEQDGNGKDSNNATIPATYNFFGWSGDEEKSEEYSTSSTAWSKDFVCPIGDVTLDKDQDVTIKYTRVESYNLAVKDLILIVEETDHVHTPDTAHPHFDADYHWYDCSDANCPIKGVKVGQAPHELVADTDETDTPSTCKTHGHEHLKCSCGYKLDNELPLAEHNWSATGTEVAADGMSTYTKYTCQNEGCTAVKLVINFNATNTTDMYGTFKSESGPNGLGFYKLDKKDNKNGTYAVFKFNYAGEAATAKLYQYGIMDNWNSNKGNKYSTSGGGDNGCNFQVNYGAEFASIVDMTATKNTTFETMLAGGDDTGLGSSYSLAKECLIGNIDIANGENQIKYQRNGSYNLANKYLAIVIG